MSAEYQGQDPFSSPAFKSLREFVMESGSRDRKREADVEEFERELHRLMSALEGDLVGQHLATYDLDVDEVRFQGQLFRRKDKYKKEYCGLAGTFEIERTLYVPRSNGGKAICPLELRAGIVEGTWTPVAARVMVRAVASTTPTVSEPKSRRTRSRARGPVRTRVTKRKCRHSLMPRRARLRRRLRSSRS